MSNFDLSFNICILSEDDYYLQEELLLIKSALLYADNITVVSPSIAEAITYYRIYGNELPYQIELTKKVYKNIGDKFEDDENKVLQFNILGENIEYSTKQMLNDLITKLDAYSKNADSDYLKRIEEISRLINGKVIFCPMPVYCEEDLKNSAKVGEIYKDIISCFSKTLYSNNGFNLCNHELYDFLQLLIPKVPVSDSQLEKFKHAKIVNNLITGLPNFEFAEIDEILDIKKELSKPLINFKKAIFEFSEQIKSAPWDDDFEYECQKLYHTQIAPALNELEQKIKDNSVMKNIFSSIMKKELLLPLVSGITGGIISGLSSLVVGSAIDIKSGIEKNATKNQDIKNNSLYFYYQAQKMLAKRKRDV